MAGNADEDVATALAELLGDAGFDATARPGSREDEPDVFVRDHGADIVIVLARSEREQPLEDRMESYLKTGRLVFGVSLPNSTPRDGANPATRVETLRREPLDVRVMTGIAPANGEMTDTALANRKTQVTAMGEDLPDLISRFRPERPAPDQLDEAVELVEEAIYEFVTELRALDRSDGDGVAENIQAALEGQTPHRESSNENETELKATLVSAGLVLFNATVLYGLLAREYEKLPALEAWTAPGRDRNQPTRAVFEDALDVREHGAFVLACRVLERLPASPAVADALGGIFDASGKALARPTLLEHDLAGRVYHTALERVRTKTYATCYTKIPAGELLAWLGITDRDAKVGEFACGSGTLVTASYHRKRSLALGTAQHQLHEQAGNSGESEMHRQFVEDDLWGLDAMRFPAHLAATNLAFQHPEVAVERTRIYHVPIPRNGEGQLGSLSLLDSPTVPIQPLPGEDETDPPSRTRSPSGTQTPSPPRSSSPATTETLRVPKDEFDLVIMNPPFTRTDRAAKYLDTSKLNSILNEEFTGRNYANTTRSGLAAPFTILGDEAVKPGGRLALVVPSGLLSRETWQPIRDFLDENYHLEHVVISWAKGEPAFSENSDFREVLVVARKLESDSDSGHFTMLTHVDEEFDFVQARLIGSELTGGIGPNRITIQQPHEEPIIDGNEKLGAVKSVPKSITGRTTDNWYRLVAFRNQNLLRLMLTVEGYLSGVHAPYNIRLPDAFSTLDAISDSVNLFMKNKKSAGYDYADEPVAGGDPVVVSSRYGRLGAEEDSGRWVYRDPSLSVTEPFEYGTGHLLVMRKMNVWSTMQVGAIASADGSRFAGSSWIPVEMPTDLTSADGKPIEPEEAARVVGTWLHSTFGMIPYLGYRAETEGAYGEWKTNQVRRITALDPSKLTREQVDDLLGIFDEHHEREWDLLRAQLRDARDEPDHPRRKLDEAVAEVVFENRTKHGDESVGLDRLYADLYETLELLGGVMS